MGLNLLQAPIKPNLINTGQDNKYTLAYTLYITNCSLIAVSSKEPINTISTFIYTSLLGLYPLEGADENLNKYLVTLLCFCQPKFGNTNIKHKQLKSKLITLNKLLEAELG